MENKELVIIDKNILKSLIRRANCWCAIVNNEEVMDRIGFNTKEWDTLFLEYVEDCGGIGVPYEATGSDALDILTEFDLDFYEVLEYDKRKND